MSCAWNTDESVVKLKTPLVLKAASSKTTTLAAQFKWNDRGDTVGDDVGANVGGHEEIVEPELP